MALERALPCVRSSGGNGDRDGKLESIEWGYLPASSRALSFHRPDSIKRRLSIAEILSAANADAARDYERFGCELRACVEQLPALKKGEIKVRFPRAVTYDQVRQMAMLRRRYAAHDVQSAFVAFVTLSTLGKLLVLRGWATNQDEIALHGGYDVVSGMAAESS